MGPLIDIEECLQDSPKFRSLIEEQEVGLDNLEHRMEKVLKVCNSMIEAGKTYVANQSQFANTLWELNICFRDDRNTNVQLNKIIHTLQEMNRFQTTLLDQASRTIVNNIHTFIKEDMKKVTESKHYFNKVSADLDLALQKNSAASKTKPLEIEDACNLLTATRTCFRHTALDHLHTITLLQNKKRHLLLSTLLSYIQACRTYFHQGYDLYEGLEPFMKELDEENVIGKQKTAKLVKKLNERHGLVNSEDLVLTGTINGSSESSTRMQGYLFKRTTNAFKTWNRRWFYLNDKQLVYRKRSGEEHATVMEEDMRLCSVRPALDQDRRFCFEVISPNKSHMVQADSEESYKSWIQALQEAIGAAIQDSKSRHVPDDQHPTITSHSHLSRVNNKPKKQMWEVLMKIPGNHLCCDCGSSDPKWASINLGITLCIECSGVHRSLGVHFSKVRSLTLDSWEPEVIKVMAELGNALINSVYLGNLPPDQQSLILSPNCDMTVREAWIRKKYIERAFVKELRAGSPMTEVQDTGLRLPKLVIRKWSVRKIRRRTRSVDNKRKLKRLREVSSEYNISSIGDDGELITRSDNRVSDKPGGRDELNSDKASQEQSEGVQGSISQEMDDDLPIVKTDMDLNCILESFKLADESSLGSTVEEKSIGGDTDVTETGQSVFYAQTLPLAGDEDSRSRISNSNMASPELLDNASPDSKKSERSLWYSSVLDNEEPISGVAVKKEKSSLYSILSSEKKKEEEKRRSKEIKENEKRSSKEIKEEEKRSSKEIKEEEKRSSKEIKEDSSEERRKSKEIRYKEELDMKDLSDSSVYTTASEKTATSGTSRFTSCSDIPSIEISGSDSTKCADVYVFGDSLTIDNEDVSNNPPLDLSSDESATESDNDVTIATDDVCDLTPELLLYRASTVHNLPVMCHAMALGVNKEWGNPNDRYRTAMHQAVISNSVMACEYLILNGGKINTPDATGKTPLYLATELGHTSQVCLLLKHKADQHIADNSGLEPLTLAVEKANADIVTLLRLGRLNEEMKESNEHGTNDETFNDVVRDFSQLS